MVSVWYFIHEAGPWLNQMQSAIINVDNQRHT